MGNGASQTQNIWAQVYLYCTTTGFGDMEVALCSIRTARIYYTHVTHLGSHVWYVTQDLSVYFYVQNKDTPGGISTFK